MDVNYAEGIVRQFESDVPDEGDVPEVVVAFRTYPPAEAIDAEAVTQDIREWLLEGRHTRFRFEERRRYTDTGAAGAAVEFILTLLGTTAAQIALEEIISFVRHRLGGEDAGWRVERFQAAATEQLRDEALSAAERVMEFGRGELTVIDFERGNFEIVLKAELRTNGQRYRVALNADESLRVRALPPESSSAAST